MNTLLLGISLDFGRIHNEHVMLAAIGVIVVFLALLILAIIYTNIPKILNMRVRNLFKKENGRKPEKGEITDVSGEVNAAIGAALHLYFNDMHDFENTNLTINREVKRQSPWADKQQVHYQYRVNN